MQDILIIRWGKSAQPSQSKCKKGRKNMLFDTYMEALQFAKDEGLTEFQIIPTVDEGMYKLTIVMENDEE